MLRFLKYLRLPFVAEELAEAEVPILDRASQLLLKAADLIEERGLERVRFQNDAGGLCIQGAIHKAAGTVPLQDFLSCNPATSSALSRISSKCPGGVAHIWIRNPSVTKEMVVAKMREAALL